MNALTELSFGAVAAGSSLVVVLVFAVVRLARGRRSDPGSTLTLFEKIGLVWRLVRFRMRWGMFDYHRRPVDAVTGEREKAIVRRNPKFMTPKEVMALVPSGSNVLSCGFAGGEVVFPFYMGLRHRFVETNEPRDLTWVHVNANGARGMAPGSMDELARPGLVKRYIAGHLETVKGMLAAGERGEVELYNTPNLTLAELVGVQAQTGATTIESAAGVGSFLDPRVGTGGRVTPNCTTSFIDAAGERLRYHLPKLDVVLLNAKFVDVEGNAYFHRSSVLTESFEGPKAVKRNGGIVLVSAQHIVPVNPSVPPELVLRHNMIDGICFCDAPRMLDPVGITAHFVARPAAQDTTKEGKALLENLWARLRFINSFIGVTPKRDATDLALGRVASRMFLQSLENAVPTDEGRLHATIGIGLPEEVSHNVFRAGLTPGKITLCTESGSYGGMPCMGMFFGTALHPERMYSEPQIIEFLKTRLHTACVGALEVDELGNVNVSRRGDSVKDFVGTGGFPNLTLIARSVVFVFSWKSGRRGDTGIHVDVAAKKVHVNPQKGQVKLIKRVAEVTFNGAEALKQGKRVWYCTNVGVFELVAGPMLQLTHVMPGVDVQRDIIDAAGVKLCVSDNLRTLGTDVLTGAGFQLKL